MTLTDTDSQGRMEELKPIQGSKTEIKSDLEWELRKIQCIAKGKLNFRTSHLPFSVPVTTVLSSSINAVTLSFLKS